MALFDDPILKTVVLNLRTLTYLVQVLADLSFRMFQLLLKKINLIMLEMNYVYVLFVVLMQ